MNSQIDSTSLQLLDEKIIASHASQEFEKCLELIDQSLKLSPSNNSHKLLQASCWISLNTNGPETFEILNKVIAEEPRNSFAYYGLGLKNYNEGNLIETIEFCSKAIEFNPTNAMQKASELKCKAKTVIEALNDANAKFQANNFEKAMRSLSTALYADPENLKIKEKILQTKQIFIKKLVERLEREVKEELTETCQKLEVDRMVVDTEGLLKKGKLEKAEQMIEEISKIDAIHKDLDYLIAFKHYMEGKLKDAVEILDEILSGANKSEKAKELRDKSSKLECLITSATERISEKKHEEAIDILSEVVTIDKCNVNINQAAYFQRSLAHYSLGNSSSALADFKMFESMQKEREVQKQGK